MWKRVMCPDSGAELTQKEKAEEAKGNLAFNKLDDKLMHSVMQNDKQAIEQGKVLAESFNRGVSSFNPDMMFEQLVKNYQLAKELYGPKLIRQLTGYSPEYVQKNIKIPEFKRVLQQRIQGRVENLKQSQLIDREGGITEKGLELASLILYTEELDNIIPKGMLGEKIHKEKFIYGEKGGSRRYQQGDRYRDLALRRSVKMALRRRHSKLLKDDLRVFTRHSKGKVDVIYALDASGSMKGRKIEMCKKAGIALAYRALDKKDRVGLMVFGTDIRKEVTPCQDFTKLLREMVRIRAGTQTNIPKTVQRATELFPEQKSTKHLILLTDALPTTGKYPEKETLEAVSLARSRDITISIIGINLTKKGQKLAERMAEIGEGRLYVVKNLEEIDKIVLEDYYSVL